MTIILGIVLSSIANGALPIMSSQRSPELRPPSVPLIAHDPYFSIWSPADKLTSASPVHWTGAKQTIRASVTIDGKTWQLMSPSADVPSLPQTGLSITPTTTAYTFQSENTQIELKFRTPAIPYDLDLLSRPITYILFSAKSLDGLGRKVQFHFSVGGDVCTSSDDQVVRSSHNKAGFLHLFSMEKASANVLGHKGDWTRIDWGKFFVGIPVRFTDEAKFTNQNTESTAKETMFTASLAPMQNIAKGSQQWLMVGYDDEFSIQYFGQNLRPYWRRNGDGIAEIADAAHEEFRQIMTRCDNFDRVLMTDCESAGGKKYAQLCALAYRQTWAANKLVADPNRQPILFPKENTSNGCIATTDVIYPMAPQFLLFGPSLTKAMLVPVLAYGSSSRWKFPFAPHDLGTYPQANGQVYGGGERTEENQMPVEESANMLILVAALDHMKPDPDFVKTYWKTLTKWAKYLADKGFDPENQLCTDDFLGHLAHNVNLSAKAIVALGCYAKLCKGQKDKAGEAKFGKMAKEFAARWMKEAADGNHTRLTFDKPGTWSQKYNLVWDKILGLGLFPDSLRAQEIAHYKKVALPFGVPLDSRGPGAKLDWSLWTATLTQKRADFEAIADPVFRYVNETPQRVGMGDWYDTSNGNHLFMHSRSVVGGAFLQLLYSKKAWQKWAAGDTMVVGEYAPIPEPPVITPIIPAADTAPQDWKYTEQTPPQNWASVLFDDSDWKTGKSGFGTPETPGAIVKTLWNSSDIWIRRTFTLTPETIKDLQLWIHHDDACEVYLNGIQVLKRSGWTTSYELIALSPQAKAALKPGENTIAIHCHQDRGGQFIDAGLVRVTNPKKP